MYIQFDKINRNDFQVSERELEGVGKVILITPTFTKHKWSDEDRHFRSLLCLPDGKVVSSGFFKFHNHGEAPELDRITEQAILNGTAWFTNKEDGSLLIRSVINGRVVFRTRGSHTMEDKFSEPIMKLIEEKYPVLLDPTIDARYSVLFEYTSPDNLIVVQYDEPKLTVLGLMDLTGDPYPEFVSDPDILSMLEASYGTPAVKFYHLPNSLPEIIDQVRGWKGKEGIVVWCRLPNGKLHLSKIKADEYKRLHALKFQLSDEKIRQLCWYKNITTLDQLKAEFFRLGVDWEAVTFVEPIFNAFISKKEKVTQQVQALIARIQEEDVENFPTRKDKARRIEELSEGNRRMFAVGIHYVMTDHDVQNHIDAMTLDVSINQLRNVHRIAQELAESVEAKNLQASE